MDNNSYKNQKLVPSDDAICWVFTHKDDNIKDNGEAWRLWKKDALERLKKRNVKKNSNR